MEPSLQGLVSDWLNGVMLPASDSPGDVYYHGDEQNFSPSESFSLMDVTEVLNTLTARPLSTKNNKV